MSYCEVGCEVAQSCLTFCKPMDCSLPGSSVHGIFQARILEWVPFSSPCPIAIVKSASMKIGVQVPLSVRVFLGYMPSSGIVGSYNTIL